MTSDNTTVHYVLSESYSFTNYAYGCTRDLFTSYFTCNGCRYSEIFVSQGWLGNGKSSGYYSHTDVMQAAKHHSRLPTEQTYNLFFQSFGVTLSPTTRWGSSRGCGYHPVTTALINFKQGEEGSSHVSSLFHFLSSKAVSWHVIDYC